MKKGWALFLIILLTAIWIISKFYDYKTELKIQGLGNDFTNQLESFTQVFSTSNSFLLGKISANEQQISGIQKQLDDYKRDSESQINGLKTDIANVTSERDNSLLRVAQLESMPQTALLVWSNTSALNKPDPDTHNFGLLVYGKPITNYIWGHSFVVAINTNREIVLGIAPLGVGEKSVEKLTIDFLANFDSTNIISGLNSDWWKIIGGTSQVFGKDAFTMEEVDDTTISSIHGFGATPFEISTNIQYFPASINIFAPGINGVETIVVNFYSP